MGRRSEQRIAVSLPIIVRGTDARGSAFSAAAQTADISVSGTRLRGIPAASVSVGSKIDIECNGARAIYRVQWVGEPDSPAAGQIGARALEPGKYIWSVPPTAWSPDSFDPLHPEFSREPSSASAAGYATWSGVERRRFPRVNCRIDASIGTEDEKRSVRGTVTDISLDGCYVEMLSPLPVDTLIQVVLGMEGADVRATGRVRSSHAGMGMGVEFLAIAPRDFERLRLLAPPPASDAVSAQNAAAPRPVAHALHADGAAAIAVEAPPEAVGHLPTTAEALEVIIRVLSRKGLLTRSELSQELARLKTAKA